MPNFDDLLSDIDGLKSGDSLSLDEDIPIIQQVEFVPETIEVVKPEIVFVQPQKIKNPESGKISISQTLIKDLFYKGEEIKHCNYYVYRTRILKDAPDISSTAMQAGLYAEQKMIGGSAHGNITTVLDRNRRSCKEKHRANCNGCELYNQCKKTALHEKLDYQVEIYKKLKENMDLDIEANINTQIKIYKEFPNEPDFMLEGTLDIGPALFYHDNEYHPSLIDLKTTGSFDNQFGYMPWGNPDAIDHIQLNTYQYLFKDINFDINTHLPDGFKLLYKLFRQYINSFEMESFYWVFETQRKIEDLSNRIIPAPWNKLIYDETHEQMRSVINLIKENYTFDRWEERTCCYQCNRCPFALTCEFKCE